MSEREILELLKTYVAKGTKPSKFVVNLILDMIEQKIKIKDDADMLAQLMGELNISTLHTSPTSTSLSTMDCEEKNTSQ